MIELTLAKLINHGKINYNKNNYEAKLTLVILTITKLITKLN